MCIVKDQPLLIANYSHDNEILFVDDDGLNDDFEYESADENELDISNGSYIIIDGSLNSENELVISTHYGLNNENESGINIDDGLNNENEFVNNNRSEQCAILISEINCLFESPEITYENIKTVIHSDPDNVYKLTSIEYIADIIMAEYPGWNEKYLDEKIRLSYTYALTFLNSI
jgi:hypothetical protein